MRITNNLTSSRVKQRYLGCRFLMSVDDSSGFGIKELVQPYVGIIKLNIKDKSGKFA